MSELPDSSDDCKYWLAIRATVSAEPVVFGPYAYESARDRRHTLLVVLRSPDSVSLVYFADDLEQAMQTCRFLTPRD